MFIINYSKEKKDASTEFLLDSEYRYILEKIGLATEGGLSSSKYYYEIDLNNKYIDYRYDFEYYEELEHISDIQRFLNNKKRKLIRRYKITEEQVLELKKYFERMNNNEKTKTPTTEEIMQEISNG